MATVRLMDELTAPQIKMLDDLFAKSEVPYQTISYNAHKAKTVEHLAALGFVTYDYVVIPEALRGRHRLSYVTTLTPKGVNAVYALAKERFQKEAKRIMSDTKLSKGAMRAARIAVAQLVYQTGSADFDAQDRRDVKRIAGYIDRETHHGEMAELLRDLTKCVKQELAAAGNDLDHPILAAHSKSVAKAERLLKEIES